jgi:cardiolipin synthase
VPGWLPNAISVLRIALVPVFLLIAAEAQAAPAGAEALPPLRRAALGVLIVIGLSDVIDGWLARRFQLETPLGASLDALADKLAQVGLLVFFAFVPGAAFEPVPAWFVWLILGHDLLLGCGWLAIRQRLGRVVVVHRAHGKLASLLVFGLLLAVTAGVPAAWFANGVAVVALVVSLSTLAYFVDGLRQVYPPGEPT